LSQGKDSVRLSENANELQKHQQDYFKKYMYQEERLQKYYNYGNLKQVAEHQHGISQADRVIFGIGQAEKW
jgi:hypothetical protein